MYRHTPYKSDELLFLVVWLISASYRDKNLSHHCNALTTISCHRCVNSCIARSCHATEIWCIFGDKYVRCTLISVAAKGDQSISCDPRFLLYGNILCRGRFLPMDIMKRCLQGITLNWLLCTGHYFYPHQYLKCLKNLKCSIKISRLYMLPWPPFPLWVLYLYLFLSIEMQSIMGTIVNCAILVDNRCRSSIALHLAERQVIRSQDSKGSEHYNMK